LVPQDNDEFCRKLVRPWWYDILDQPGDHLAKNNPSAEVLDKESGEKDLDEQDHRGTTALMEAAMKPWPNGISQLISMKAQLNIAAKDNTRAIHLASAHGVYILRLLVEAKACLDVQDNDPGFDPEFTSKSFGDRIEHRTPLHYVCAEGDTASAALLLEAGAKPNIQDAQWMTPLHLAINAENTGCIDLLLSFGADTNLGNKSSGLDNSALLDAALAGKTELAKKLIAAKADINKQGKQGMSALHLAARQRHSQVAEVLLAAKADMGQESKCGTALQLARKNGGIDLLQVFGVQPVSDIISANLGTATCFSSLDAAQRAALCLE